MSRVSSPQLVYIVSQMSKLFILYLCLASDHCNWSILCHHQCLSPLSVYIISISGVGSPRQVHIVSQSVPKSFILYLCLASTHRTWFRLCYNQCLSPLSVYIYLYLSSTHRNWSILCHECLSPLYYIYIWCRLTALGPYCVTISV